jgi:hypothetical protein
VDRSRALYQCQRQVVTGTGRYSRRGEEYLDARSAAIQSPPELRAKHSLAWAFGSGTATRVRPREAHSRGDERQ